MEVTTKKFEWETRWLKGDEYHYMLTHIDLYSECFKMQKFSKKSHPTEIYLSPINGQIYFLQGENIENDFGFPRLDIKKAYKWKKTNFTTDIPKKKPLVRYLVASATRFQEKGKPSFRMHAVILNEPGESPYILCHIRQLHSEPPKSPENLLKKFKRQPLSPISNGLHFLLDAANTAISPVKYLGEENDYVTMFKASTVDKFPALSSHFKPLFTLSKET